MRAIGEGGREREERREGGGEFRGGGGPYKDAGHAFKTAGALLLRPSS